MQIMTLLAINKLQGMNLFLDIHSDQFKNCKFKY